MSYTPTRRHVLIGSAAAALGIAPQASAQAAWPARPVRVIVPYPPAGGADTVSRILFQKLGEMWGQQFVIDNRGGAGGTIGEAAAAKADPDGYTVLYDATAFSVNPALYARLSFDYGKDFQPVFLASLVPNLLLVHPSVPAKTVPEFVAWLRAQNGKVSYASSGTGQSPHLSAAWFLQLTGTKAEHIPYRGAAPALQDLTAGVTQFFFDNLTTGIEFVRAGKLRALGITSAQRNPLTPELVPICETMPELKPFDVSTWFGVFLPAATPKPVVAAFNEQMKSWLDDPKTKERFTQMAGFPAYGTPAEFE